MDTVLDGVWEVKSKKRSIINGFDRCNWLDLFYDLNWFYSPKRGWGFEDLKRGKNS